LQLGELPRVGGRIGGVTGRRCGGSGQRGGHGGRSRWKAGEGLEGLEGKVCDTEGPKVKLGNYLGLGGEWERAQWFRAGGAEGGGFAGRE
jgi:hypothetical protein